MMWQGCGKNLRQLGNDEPFEPGKNNEYATKVARGRDVAKISDSWVMNLLSRVKTMNYATKMVLILCFCMVLILCFCRHQSGRVTE